MNLELSFTILIFLQINFNFIFFINFKKISSLINIFDYPNVRKKHDHPVPLIGGTLIACNFIFITLYLYFFNSSNIEFDIIFFIFGYISFFFLGLYDDKLYLNAYLKLLISILILLPIVFFDSNVQLTILKFSFIDNYLSLNNFSIFITILFFLLFINAFNMFDGINCQNGLYSIVLVLVLLFSSNKNFFLYGLLMSLIIFTYFNFKNKFFLGDSGTLSLSFLFSYLFIMYYNKQYIIFSDQVYLYMFLPGLELMRLYLFRLVKKRNPFKPDRNHLHHFFLDHYGYNKTIIAILSFIIIPILLSYFVETLILNILSLLIYLYFIFFRFKGSFK